MSLLLQLVLAQRMGIQVGAQAGLRRHGVGALAEGQRLGEERALQLEVEPLDPLGLSRVGDQVQGQATGAPVR